MSEQEQTNQSLEQDIQNLEAIIHQLESEIRNVENTVHCQSLRRVTINFLQIIKSRAESKIQTLRKITIRNERLQKIKSKLERSGSKR